MTRLLVVGDSHCNMDWVCSQVIPWAVSNGATKILQLGDFGFIWPRPNYLAGLDKLNRVLRNNSLDLHFLPGNHEDHNKLEWFQKRGSKYSLEGHLQIRPHIFYTGRVAVWEWDGWRCAAIGGATSIDKRFRTLNRSWWKQEELTEAEAYAASRLGPVDILFSHDAPVQNPFNLKLDQDSAIHRQRITDVAQALRPRRWFHGHYHRYAEYSFMHQRGYADVIGLDCDGTPLARSTKVLDLESMSPVADGYKSVCPPISDGIAREI